MVRVSVRFRVRKIETMYMNFMKCFHEIPTGDSRKRSVIVGICQSYLEVRTVFLFFAEALL